MLDQPGTPFREKNPAPFLPGRTRRLPSRATKGVVGRCGYEPARSKCQSTLTASPGFVEWLAREDVSLAFTTYQSGKLFLIGRHEDDR